MRSDATQCDAMRRNTAPKSTQPIFFIHGVCSQTLNFRHHCCVVVSSRRIASHSASTHTFTASSHLVHFCSSVTTRRVDIASDSRSSVQLVRLDTASCATRASAIKPSIFSSSERNERRRVRSRALCRARHAPQLLPSPFLSPISPPPSPPPSLPLPSQSQPSSLCSR